MEPFLQCQFIFLEISSLYPRRKTPVLDTYYRSGRRSCDFSLMRKATLYLHLRWFKRFVYLVFCILLSGEIKEKKKQFRFNIKKNSKKIIGECRNDFRFFHFRMESSVLKWISFWWLKFEDVWKLIFLCRLFYSSSFGASFPVSTKEFLWDLSFNAKL